VAEKTGQKVEPKQIELGYELDRGRLVAVDPEELDQLRRRQRAR
jgi:non-homologous end joining protein Ku